MLHFNRAGLGLTGCQLINLQSSIEDLRAAGFGVIEAMEGVVSIVTKDRIEKRIDENLQKLTITTRPLEPLTKINLEKKPKYIRQQHKLAQRHYRRK